MSLFGIGGGGGKGGQESTTTAAPWGPQQDYLKRGFKGAKGLLGKPTFAPFAQEQETAMQGITNRALEGNPLTGQAQSAMGDILRGEGPVMDAVVGQVRPGTDSAFAGGGRYGSGIHSQTLGRGVAQGFAPYMTQAAQMAPALANQDYFDMSQLMGVGQQRQDQAQRQVDDRYNQLQRYMSLIGGNRGGVSETDTRNRFDPWSTALGGAFLGSGMGWF